MINFMKKDKNEFEEIINSLKGKSSRLLFDIENLRRLDKRVEIINSKISEIENNFKILGYNTEHKTISSKTEETLKLIMQKNNGITVYQLCKIIKLSRNRCSEYLKKMEEEGIVTSSLTDRKKVYFIKRSKEN